MDGVQRVVKETPAATGLPVCAAPQLSGDGGGVIRHRLLGGGVETAAVPCLPQRHTPRRLEAWECIASQVNGKEWPCRQVCGSGPVGNLPKSSAWRFV